MFRKQYISLDYIPIKFLFKYYPDTPHFEMAMKGNFLYYGSANLFNDPFDCNISVDSDATVEEYKAYIKRNNQNQDLGDYFLNTIAERMHKNREIARTLINTSLRNAFYKLGVCCFTIHPDNILMWSHYSHCHEGFCLRFDVAKMMTNNQYGFKVNYSADYPIFNVVKNDDDDNFTEQLLGTKSKHWSYEDEYRFISRVQKENYFAKDALVEVIFGVRCKPERQEEIIEMFKEYGYNPIFSQTVLKPSQFGLDIVRLL